MLVPGAVNDGPPFTPRSHQSRMAENIEIGGKTVGRNIELSGYVTRRDAIRSGFHQHFKNGKSAFVGQSG